MGPELCSATTLLSVLSLCHSAPQTEMSLPIIWGFWGFFVVYFKIGRLTVVQKINLTLFISVSFSRANPKLTTDPDALGIDWGVYTSVSC